MREGVSVADADVDGHGERTTAQRHRYFQGGIIADGINAGIGSGKCMAL
jgi:hypothetical protein